MKLRLLILLITFTNLCFGMKQEEQEAINPEIFKNLPLEKKYEILVHTFRDRS